MASLLTFILSITEAPLFIFSVILISFFIKFYFLRTIVPQGLRTSNIQKPWLFLVALLVTDIIDNSAWIVMLGRKLWFASASYSFVTFIIRFAWAFTSFRHLLLCLFLQSLTDKNFRLNLLHKIIIGVNSSFSVYFLFIAFFDQRFTEEITRYSAFNALQKPLELTIMRIVNVYSLLLIAVTLVVIGFKIYKNKYQLPRILRHQLTILLFSLMLPYFLAEACQASLVLFKPDHANSTYSIVGLATLLLICATFYCALRVMGLRFLNFKEHVTSPVKFNFINDFNSVLEQLSHATTFKELEQITQLFFKDAFKIPLSKVELQSLGTTHQQNITPQRIHIENFIANSAATTHEFIHKSKILIFDEITFNNFYEDNETRKNIVLFLDHINADIFIPIYDKQHSIIAYIKVERTARRHNVFYSNIERDEMLVFTSYLENIITLLQHKNLNNLIQQEKDLKDELYKKHQEINQYKESINTAIRSTKSNDVGILFYKAGRLTIGNHRAKELLANSTLFNFGSAGTSAHDDQFSTALKQLARQIEEYKTPQKTTLKDNHGNTLIAAGLLNQDQNGVIITIRHEEILSTIKQQIDLLKDPSTWDYLLYLETTQSGKLIHKLLPGNNETFLNFKITLLKIALSKKAILLEMNDHDLMPTVELLHHISLRETLHVLTLQGQSKGFDIAIKLLGINPIFGLNEEEPLLKKLDRTGTLFIQNIHLLDLDTQHYLAEYIKTGFYRIFKSDRKASSDVRIICSTSQNLHQLVQEGKFSKALFQELKATSLHMPPLTALSDQEFYDLTQSITDQIAHTTEKNDTVLLSDTQKNTLAIDRPTNLTHLKKRIVALTEHKDTSPHIYHEKHINADFDVKEPELIKAAQLGKHALKDPTVMALLWKKFQNQNKIASFLGVNRSSVNRRCKEYNLI